MNFNNIIDELPQRYHMIFHEFEEIFENDFDCFCEHYHQTKRYQVKHILDTGKLVCQMRFSEN